MANTLSSFGFCFFLIIGTVASELQIHDKKVLKIIIVISISSMLITHTCKSYANSLWSEAKNNTSQSFNLISIQA